MNTPAKFVPVLVTLALCAALPVASFASPLIGPSQSAPLKPGVRVPIAKKLLNGIVEVDIVSSGKGNSTEFATWVTEHSFFEAPAMYPARWRQNNEVASLVRWELHELGTTNQVIATGEVAPLTKLNSTRRFDLELGKFLPKYNETSKDKVYELRMVTQDPSFFGIRYSAVAKLTHKRKSSRTKSPPEDPFTCSTSTDDYERVVSVNVPVMIARKGTNTAYEGADEPYFEVAHAGPGSYQQQLRLPGADLTYKIAPGATVGLYDWKNDNGDHVGAPYLYAGHLRHGESVTVVAWALEDDWDELESIKQGVITAMGWVATAGKIIGGPYGDTVAAVAAGVATVNANYVPNIDKDDVLGGVAFHFENRCGRIKSGWLNLDADVDGEKVTSKFIDVATHSVLDTRLTALFVDDPNTLSGFSPTGWDYGEYTYAGEYDQFIWSTWGTSGSNYDFALLAQVALPLP